MIKEENKKKTIDPAWDKAYKDGWGRKYPSENLVRFLCRYKKTEDFKKKNKILDLGCGSGANTKMMYEEGYDTYAVDGSIYAVRKAKKFLLNKEVDLKVCDFSGIDKAYNQLFFDIICDDVSIYANRINNIKDILKKISLILKKNGLFYSSCFSTKTSGFGLGKKLEPGTFTDINKWPFRDRGITHFYTGKELRRIYGKFFEIESFDTECYTEFNKQNKVFKFVLICRKK